MPYVHDSFRQAILNHLAGNFLVKGTESPLILGIFGPPGEGKTFQTEVVCADLGVETLLVSPGELESENAGHPGQLLRTCYLNASSECEAGRPTVIVINDVDTVLGDWGSLVQYTVNRQIVYGQLMAFCDFPEQVAGKNTRRVPIIFTGNNPSILYGPLMRPGRMRTLEWAPDVQIKTAIVASLFREVTSGDVFSLVSQRPLAPIAFWSDVKAAIWERRVSIWLSRQDEHTIERMLSRGEKVDLGSESVDRTTIELVAGELERADVRDRDFLHGGLN